MARRKNYEWGKDRLAAKPHDPTSGFERDARCSAIDFYEEVGPTGRVAGGRGIDLSDWLGHGIDKWVYDCIACMREMLRGKVLETATIENRRAGLRNAFAFLSRANAGHVATCPEQLTIAHIRGYYKWLESQWRAGQLQRESARKYYSHLKAMLDDLHQYGYLSADPVELFRDNAFRTYTSGNCSAASTSTPPLSDTEQRRLAKALKSDLVASHHGRLVIRPSELATCKYLVVAMRTGDSTTPILELSRSQPKDGPVPGTMVLTSHKRRAHKRVQRLLRAETKNEDAELEGANQSPKVVSPDAAAILRVVLAETKPLVTDAPPRYKDRIWLYRTTRGEGAGRVTALTQAAVQKSTQAIVRRHGLKGDDGQPLRVNTRRLRATFGHLAYEVTGGDIFQTSDLLGNTPKVAGSNYLPITEKIKLQGAAFVNGLAARLAQGLKKEKRAATPASVDAVKTPVSGCHDPLHGEFAPKDGSNYCDDWVMCLFCPQFAITGDEEELWRLFSFRTFAEKELERLEMRYGTGPTGEERSDLLKQLYRTAIPFIGEFARKHFKDRVVNRAEQRAQRQMHPFWAYQNEIAMMRR